MKKLLILMVVCCTMLVSAGDKTTAEVLSGKIWKLDTENIVLDVDLTKKSHHAERLEVVCAFNTITVDSPEPPTSVFNGQTFIVKGYIYPEGTLAANDLNGGVTADGEAEWPDLVIGTWVCRGWVWEPAPQTTQVYYMGDDQLTTDGNENEPTSPYANRAVAGGRGKYSHARGEVLQTVVGINPTTGPNFYMDFTFQKDINFKK